MQTGFYGLLGKRKMVIALVLQDISPVSIYVDEITCLNRRLYQKPARMPVACCGVIHYHSSEELIATELETAYQCLVAMIAHSIPHQIWKSALSLKSSLS
jgi:ABC-type Mn2+/Zn2+ transport system ATPase subunit